MSDTQQPVKEQWAIIIDTDSYAGNFEREMVAFITGLETIRGERFWHEFHAAHGASDKEHGFDWQTDDRNPLALVFIKWPRDYGDGYISHDYAWITSTPDYANNGNGSHNNVVNLSKKEQKKHKYPAFGSVIIRCYDKPSDENVALVKEWAEKFAARSRVEKATPPKDWKKQQEFRGANPFHSVYPLNILGVRVTCDPSVTLAKAY